MKPIQYPVFAALVICLGLYVGYRNYPWWNDGDLVEKWIGGALGCLVVGLCGLLSMGLAAGTSKVVADHSEWEWRTCWKGKMVSLRGSDGVAGSIHGGIFMVSGNIGSEQFYHYYTAEKDGGFAPHKWKLDSHTRVYEEDRQDGQVVQFNKHFKNDWVLWFADPDDGLAMDFHIPKGSLKQQFSLD